MHQPPARRFENSNFPLPSVDVVTTSGGVAKVLQSARRISIDAAGIGCPDPITTTVPESDAVPRGSCWPWAGALTGPSGAGGPPRGACATANPRTASTIMPNEKTLLMNVVGTLAEFLAVSK